MKTTDPHELRRAFGRFLTGVTVITCKDSDGTPRGFTANSLTSVSLNPALLLVCIAKSAASRAVFENADSFAINILSAEQKDISGIFATKQADKFTQVAWEDGEHGSPLLKDVVAWFECTRYRIVDAGDHIILIGEVKDFEHQELSPLGYGPAGYFKATYLDAEEIASSAPDGEAMPLPDD